ncbi:lipase family protein [Corynebacterium cystitidis]|uniref:lipase family protein n=1 Tax=Corynebacterium cystitidis TaxID=35757 RepID=UPI00211EDE5A|nr:lipase family protein [Corynebacterium cystitidis]
MMQRLFAVGLVASLSSLSPVLSSVGSSTLDMLSSATSSGSSVSELSSQVLDDDRLASTPGDLIAREPVAGSRGQRIRYSTTNEAGQLVPATGAVYEARDPQGPQSSQRSHNPKGTVVVAPGTRGVAPHCAPSAGSSMLSSLSGSSVNVNYEAPFVDMLTDAGYRVVVTDYIGPAQAAVHSYLNRTEQAHAVLDAARAVLDDDTPVAIFGYSQGGGAAAAAAELHDDYAPELNLVGTFAGAPPADLVAVLEQGNPYSLTAVAGFAALGFAGGNDEFAAALQDHLTPDGITALINLAESCVIDASLSARDTKFEDYTVGNMSLGQIAAEDPRIRRVLEANRLGNEPVESPILIVTTDGDNLVPAEQVRQLARDYCALGGPDAPVELREVTGNWKLSSQSGLIHAVPLVMESAGVIEWLDARFAGQELNGTCGIVPAPAPTKAAR